MLKVSKASFNVKLTWTSRFVKLNSYTLTSQLHIELPRSSSTTFKGFQPPEKRGFQWGQFHQENQNDGHDENCKILAI
jgi:hypothetical protein